MQIEDRIRWLRRSIALNPRFAPAYQDLARLLAEQGDRVEANRLALEAIRRDPTRRYPWAPQGQTTPALNESNEDGVGGWPVLSWTLGETSRRQTRTF